MSSCSRPAIRTGKGLIYMTDNILSGSEVQRHGRTGRPTKVRGEFALPPAPAPAGPAALAAGPSSMPPPAGDAPIRAFLAQHAAELALPAGEGDLKLIQDVRT